jgi:RNA polymerase sigma factor (TIGR02999 family)
MSDNRAALHKSTTTLLVSGDLTDPVTLDRLVPAIYEELRAMAHRQLAGERPGHTLQTTALVHEAYLRLVDHTGVTTRGRAYFFGAAARAMRQVLVEHARRRGARKRSPGAEAPSLDAGVPVDAFADDLLDLNRALDELATRHPRLARVVECRYFGGLSVEETADALEISPRTVKYDWAMARAWLFRELSPDAGR